MYLLYSYLGISLFCLISYHIASMLDRKMNIGAPKITIGFTIILGIYALIPILNVLLVIFLFSHQIENTILYFWDKTNNIRTFLNKILNYEWFK